MRVKVGNKIYDETHGPIMILLAKRDKDLISNMHPDDTKYCVFPDDDKYIEAEIEKWMKET